MPPRRDALRAASVRNLLGADGSVDRRLIAVLLDEELRSAVDGQAAGYSRARTGRSKLRALGLGFPIVVARLECLSRDTVVIGDLIADDSSLGLNDITHL